MQNYRNRLILARVIVKYRLSGFYAFMQNGFICIRLDTVLELMGFFEAIIFVLI